MKRMPPNASRQERDRALSILLRIFKRECEYVMHSFKEHEFFQRKCDLRRKKKESSKIAAKLADRKPKPNRNQQEDW